jgi:general stress protein 26
MSLQLTQESAEITKFLNSHHIGVLATANKEGVPHAATIYFANDTDLNIYFITKKDTTKHKNLESNPKASLAVYEAHTQSTVQVRGTVSVVEDMSTFQEVFARILGTTEQTSESVVPPVSRLESGGYIGYCLKPESARLAVYTRPEHNTFDKLFDVAIPEGEEIG